MTFRQRYDEVGLPCRNTKCVETSITYSERIAKRSDVSSPCPSIVETPDSDFIEPSLTSPARPIEKLKIYGGEWYDPNTDPNRVGMLRKVVKTLVD